MNHKPAEKGLLENKRNVSIGFIHPLLLRFKFSILIIRMEKLYEMFLCEHDKWKRSDTAITENNIFIVNDQTPFYDEIRMVMSDFAVCLWKVIVI